MSNPETVNPQPFSEPTFIKSNPDPDLLAEIKRLRELGYGPGQIGFKYDGPSVVSIILFPKPDQEKSDKILFLIRSRFVR